MGLVEADGGARRAKPPSGFEWGEREMGAWFARGIRLHRRRRGGGSWSVGICRKWWCCAMLETWISLVIYLIEQYLVLAFHLTQDGVIGETSSFGETPGSSCHAVRPRGC